MVQADHDLGLTEREKMFTYKHINLTVKKVFMIAINVRHQERPDLLFVKVGFTILSCQPQNTKRKGQINRDE